MIESVAVIGIGAMGSAMTEHLINGGYRVFAFDVDIEARKKAVDLGAVVTDSPGEAASRAEVSLIVVGTYDQVEEVLCGDDGIFSMAEERHVVAISSTISPALSS